MSSGRDLKALRLYCSAELFTGQCISYCISPCISLLGDRIMQTAIVLNQQHRDPTSLLGAI